MKNYLVKDLMVPLSEYATVFEDATLFDAMLALDKSQAEFDHTKYTHRSILVLNQSKQVIGKLTFIDVIKAVGPHSNVSDEIKKLGQYGFSPKLMKQKYKTTPRKSDTLQHIYQKAAKLRVKECMQTPTKGEYVEQDIPLRLAIHQLVIGEHLALLVTDKNKIIGILRLTDVFAAVFHTMKACENSP